MLRGNFGVAFSAPRCGPRLDWMRRRRPGSDPAASPMRSSGSGAATGCSWARNPAPASAGTAEQVLHVEGREIRVLRDDSRDHVLLARHAVRGRNAIDVDVVDGGYLGNRLLDEAGVDEFTVAADAASLPVEEIQPAVIVLAHDVAHVQPAVCTLLRAGLWIPVVLHAERGAVLVREQQFARALAICIAGTSVPSGSTIRCTSVGIGLPMLPTGPTPGGLAVSPPSAAP